ncbi:MAG: hypothetical protein D6698_15060 [Gammaproteobacteria bacterium]|nr:MAG: hypothetical protein D6698_15060 [Gammaproteobacteria bacterium]
MKVAADMPIEAPSTESENPAEQFVFLTVPGDVAQNVEVGKEIEITLKGRVKGISERDGGKDGNGYTLEIAVSSVNGEDEKSEEEKIYEDLAED